MDNRLKRWIGFLLATVLLTGCQANMGVVPQQALPVSERENLEYSASLPIVVSLAEPMDAQGSGEPVTAAIPIEEPPAPIAPTETAPPATATRPVAAAETSAPALAPEAWKEWPVIPTVSEEMRQVYQHGLAEGRNPNAFSILGDCQSQPEVFLGVFDSDLAVITGLPSPLRQTVAHFQGSFDRYSPTVKDGTTEGALLWAEWNDNKEKKCEPGETPLDCELRVQQPSIVFIHIGTHWESRQMKYMRKIIERVLEHGAVPVMVTKADNRELDEKINPNLVLLAHEYRLPVWNFWRTVQHLPNRGMEKDSRMYLSPEGLAVHRTSALEALDAVWRGLQ